VFYPHRETQRYEGFSLYRWIDAPSLVAKLLLSTFKPGFKDVALRPFKTGPNIVRFVIGETQYKLNPKQKTDAMAGSGKAFRRPQYNSVFPELVVSAD
jgi:hypothetical protein